MPEPGFDALAHQGSELGGATAEPTFGRIALDPPHRGASPLHRSGPPLPFLSAIQRSFGHYDVTGVRSRADAHSAGAARSLGADAYTQGEAVTFARAPTVRTAAHEAAHVIQQREGTRPGIGAESDAWERHAEQIAERVERGASSEALLAARPAAGAARPPALQLRRVPPNVRAILTSAAGGNAANFVASAAGARRLVHRALAELTAAETATVNATARAGLTQAEFTALPEREQLSREAEAIVSHFSNLEHGDPNLIDTGPRPATSDAANITAVVGNANAIFTSIASGGQDANITQVFGAANLAAAKAKYAEARTWLNTLHGTDRIVTDRSGYSSEASEGGLTGFHEIIRLDSDVIDNPNSNDSVVTLIHESMHAGNNDIADNIYITAAGFQTQQEGDKLVNAAHFEVVPWRILDPANTKAFPVTPATTPPTFEVFVPAGTTVGGVTAPARTIPEQGAIAAYEMFRGAWALGLNLHRPYVQLFRTPTDWTVPQPSFGNRRFDRSLRFWSKVQKLTIHEKISIVPASADPDRHPVSQIDVALSEGLIRKLGNGMDVFDPLRTEAQILAFESANATAAELNTAFPGGAHTSAADERDFLVKLAVKQPSVKPMTGNEARDVRVVRKMGDPSLVLWRDILAPRNPNSFPD